MALVILTVAWASSYRKDYVAVARRVVDRTPTRLDPIGFEELTTYALDFQRGDVTVYYGHAPYHIPGVLPIPPGDLRFATSTMLGPIVTKPSELPWISMGIKSYSRLYPIDYRNMYDGIDYEWAFEVPLYLFALPLTLINLRLAKEACVALRRRARLKCPACGYDLRATPNRCPECGWQPEQPIVA